MKLLLPEYTLLLAIPQEECILHLRRKVEFNIIRQVQNNLLEVGIRINVGTPIGLNINVWRSLLEKEY